MKVLIIGGYGLLGTEIYNYFTSMGYEICRLAKKEFDITDPNSIVPIIKKHQPDLIIHAAGFTNVDLAEKAPFDAYNVNSLSMYQLLFSLTEKEPIIVFFSTDYVFDGNKGSPYVESDPCRPVNIYGMSKLLAEDILRANYSKFYIIRTSWLFGQAGRCFPNVIYRKLKNSSEPLYVVNDQFGSPTYTKDLAGCLVDLLKCPFGTYHITNTGYTSWFEVAQIVANEKGFNTDRIKPIRTCKLDTTTKRPNISILDNSKWESYNQPLGQYNEALKKFLKSI